MYKYVDTGIYVTERRAVKDYIGQIKENGSKFDYSKCRTMDQLFDEISKNNDDESDELLGCDDGLFRVIECKEKINTDDSRTYKLYENGKKIDEYTEFVDDTGSFDEWFRANYSHSILE